MRNRYCHFLHSTLLIFVCNRLPEKCAVIDIDSVTLIVLLEQGKYLTHAQMSGEMIGTIASRNCPSSTVRFMPTGKSIVFVAFQFFLVFLKFVFYFHTTIKKTKKEDAIGKPFAFPNPVTTARPSSGIDCFGFGKQIGETISSGITGLSSLK